MSTSAHSLSAPLTAGAQKNLSYPVMALSMTNPTEPPARAPTIAATGHYTAISLPPPPSTSVPETIARVSPLILAAPLPISFVPHGVAKPLEIPIGTLPPPGTSSPFAEIARSPIPRFAEIIPPMLNVIALVTRTPGVTLCA